jgi:ABC-2 type transport system ATP-binding protein
VRPTVIRVEQLTKIYGATVAIDQLDFRVQKGEIVGFLGPNGAGKTTTMRILCGALGATSGRALVGGRDVLEEPRAVKRMIGYLPEVPPLYPEMSVRGFLRFCARIKRAEDPKKATERAIERVGLKEVAHRLIGHLSKGYRQRVGIASALVHDPEVLVLDEPASGLDPAQRVEIRSLVKELASGDTTVVLSTHVLPEVEAICDRAIIINNGRIVAVDDVSALAKAHATVSVTVREPAGMAERFGAIEGVTGVESLPDGEFRLAAAVDIREAVARSAMDAGLLELTSKRDLEDVYLRLTREDA